MNETEKQIVAWLREMAFSPALGALEAYRVMVIVDAIERGEHSKREKE